MLQTFRGPRLQPPRTKKQLTTVISTLKFRTRAESPGGSAAKGQWIGGVHRLSEEPEDQDDNKDKSQNAARTTRPKAAVAVSAAAQENEKQNNNENCNHGLPPDAPNAHLNVAPSLF